MRASRTRSNPSRTCRPAAAPTRRLPCDEADAQRIALCGTVPSYARVDRIELFAQPDAVQHPWEPHRAAFEQDLGGARFTGNSFEYAQANELKAVCVNFMQWSSEHPHIARILVQYGFGDAPRPSETPAGRAGRRSPGPRATPCGDRGRQPACHPATRLSRRRPSATAESADFPADGNPGSRAVRWIRGKSMFGQMMDRPLLISAILRHAELQHPSREIVSITADHPRHRYTFREAFARSRKLANALQRLGMQHGDRVATLAWNDFRHFEIYYGVSCSGFVCHTINPRLFEDQIVYIVNHAEDRWLFLDPAFVPLIEKLQPRLPKLEGCVIMTDDAHMPATSLRQRAQLRSR